MLTWRSSNSCAQELHYGSMLASHSFPMKLALLLLGKFVFRGNALQAGFPVLMHSFVQESSACKKRRAKQAAKGKIAKVAALLEQHGRTVLSNGCGRETVNSKAADSSDTSAHDDAEHLAPDHHQIRPRSDPARFG